MFSSVSSGVISKSSRAAPIEREGCSNCVSASQFWISNDFMKAEISDREHERKDDARNYQIPHRVLVLGQLSHTGCRVFYVNLQWKEKGNHS